MARLPALAREDVPEEYRHLYDVDEDDPEDLFLTVHRVWANDPELLEQWGTWAGHLSDAIDDPRTRELTILAVARAVDSRYVWHQHVTLAHHVGITRAELLALSAGDVSPFSPAETALIEYVSSMVTGTVDDELHDTLARQFDPPMIVAVAFLASEYVQISTMIDAFAIEPEEAFVGWDLDNLD